MASVSSISADRDRAPRELDVLVIEPHEIARLGLHSMLESVVFVHCVRSVGSGDAARETLRQKRADVILVSADIGEFVADVIDLTDTRRTMVLLLMRKDDRDALDAASRHTVDGFLMEPDLTVTGLSDALVAISCGQTPMPTALADHLLAQARTRNTFTSAMRLTPRERRVLGLLVEGKTNKEIAGELSISTHGVKRHVANLLAKMHAPNRTQAVAQALRDGIVIPVES